MKQIKILLTMLLVSVILVRTVQGSGVTSEGICRVKVLHRALEERRVQRQQTEPTLPFKASAGFQVETKRC